MGTKAHLMSRPSHSQTKTWVAKVLAKVGSDTYCTTTTTSRSRRSLVRTVSQIALITSPHNVLNKPAAPVHHSRTSCTALVHVPQYPNHIVAGPNVGPTQSPATTTVAATTATAADEERVTDVSQRCHVASAAGAPQERCKAEERAERGVLTRSGI